MTKMFTNPTGAYGYTADGNQAGQVVLEFEVAGSDAAAVTITRGQVVALNATGKAIVATGETVGVVGVALDTVTVLETDPETDEYPSYTGPKTIRVCVQGLCEALTDGGAETLGTALYADASGQVTGTAGYNAQDHHVGWAIETLSAGAAGTLITIYVNPGVTTAAS